MRKIFADTFGKSKYQKKSTLPSGKYINYICNDPKLSCRYFSLILYFQKSIAQKYQDFFIKKYFLSSQFFKTFLVCDDKIQKNKFPRLFSTFQIWTKINVYFQFPNLLFNFFIQIN